MLSSEEHKEPPPYSEAVNNHIQRPSQPPFACLSISAYDRFRLIGFPQPVVTAIHAIIRDTWAKGLDSIQSVAGAQEIKLNGTPWIPNIKGDDESRKLILAVVEKLYALGWVTCTSVRFTLRLSVDKGMLFSHATQFKG